MISVALAAYNGERFIREQLQSIAAQSLPVDEVVICDDCSTDQTAETAERFIRDNNLIGWQVIAREKNIGYCMNFWDAIARTSGNLIFLADQDDVWLPERVAVMADMMGQHPEIWALSSRYTVIDGEGQPVKDLTGVTNVGKNFDGGIEPITVESLIGCSYVRGFSLCFRRELIPFLKPLELSHLLAHDWYICMQAALNGECAFLNACLTRYRMHGRNVSLTAVSRKTLIGDREKRKEGLRESVAAHETLLDPAEQYPHLRPIEKKHIRQLIKFEKRRLRFLETKNPFRWIVLLGGCKQYARVYKSFTGGIKIWLGDFCYGYGINWNRSSRSGSV